MSGKNFLTKNDFNQFEETDSRYYGVFIHKIKDDYGMEVKKEVKIDPKRFSGICRELTSEQLLVMGKRKTHYFYPAKEHRSDYHCNQFEAEITKLQQYWKLFFHPLIQIALDRVKKPEKQVTAGYEPMLTGISGFNSASTVTLIMNGMNEEEYRRQQSQVVRDMYAQFIHHLASAIEAVTIEVLASEKIIEDHFDRNTLYATAIKTGKKITELPHFKDYDKLYSLWNFIKHSSKSTYDKLRTVYPECLCKAQYSLGGYAQEYIIFDEEMITSLMQGISCFFKEYCELVFNENYNDAQWNYSDYFVKLVDEEIEAVVNPYGLSFFDIGD